MFIKTTDKQTADMLMTLGFVLIEHEGDIWVFLNDPDRQIDSKNIVYTDVLEGI